MSNHKILLTILGLLSLNVSAKEYVFPPLEEAEPPKNEILPNDYSPNREERKGTYFERPGYKFPPLEERPNNNAFSQQPAFPPLEKQEPYSPPYRENDDYSNYRQERPYYPSRNYSRDPYSKKSYNSRRQRHRTQDYGRNNYYDPYSHMSMPFQNMFNGGNGYGNNKFNPFTGNMNSMPFYNSSDFSNMAIPGFFSR